MRCIACHYSLKNLTEHRCRECDREFDPDDPNTFDPESRSDSPFLAVVDIFDPDSRSDPPFLVVVGMYLLIAGFLLGAVIAVYVLLMSFIEVWQGSRS